VPSDDVISILEWIQDSTKTARTHLMGRMVLCGFARANEKLPSDPFAFGKYRGHARAVPLEKVVEATERVLDDIKAGPSNLYVAARRFVNRMIERHFSPNTIGQWRSKCGSGPAGTSEGCDFLDKCLVGSILPQTSIGIHQIQNREQSRIVCKKPSPTNRGSDGICRDTHEDCAGIG